MTKIRYIMGDQRTAMLSKEMPLPQAVVVDLDPELTFYDRNGPERRDEMLETVSAEFSAIGIPVSGIYECTRRADEETTGTKILIINGEGIDKKYVKGIADKAAGEDIDSHVCPLLEND